MSPGTIPTGPFIVVCIASLAVATLAEVARYVGLRRVANTCHLLVIAMCVGTAALAIYYAQGGQ
jgi:hypothetical protein